VVPHYRNFVDSLNWRIIANARFQAVGR